MILVEAAGVGTDDGRGIPLHGGWRRIAVEQCRSHGFRAGATVQRQVAAGIDRDRGAATNVGATEIRTTTVEKNAGRGEIQGAVGADAGIVLDVVIVDSADINSARTATADGNGASGDNGTGSVGIDARVVAVAAAAPDDGDG